MSSLIFFESSNISKSAGTPPDVYHTVLLAHLTRVTALAKQYQKPYRLMVSGSGTTQLFETLTTSYCSGAGGGPAYDKFCPHTMSEWMTAALDVFDTLKVKEDPLFQGIGIYGWTTTNGAGFSPVTPTTDAIQVLTDGGYLPNANNAAPSALFSSPPSFRKTIVRNASNATADCPCEALGSWCHYAPASAPCPRANVCHGTDVTCDCDTCPTSGASCTGCNAPPPTPPAPTGW